MVVCEEDGRREDEVEQREIRAAPARCASGGVGGRWGVRVGDSGAECKGEVDVQVSVSVRMSVRVSVRVRVRVSVQPAGTS